MLFRSNNQVHTDGRNPMCSSEIKISINGSVNSFSILSEDTTPLLQKIVQDYPPVFLPQHRNYRYTYCFPTHFPFFNRLIKLPELPEAILGKRLETRQIGIERETFIGNMSPAGQASEIIETIQALKCMEVFLA